MAVIITDIEEISKTKARISTDSEHVFALYKNEIRSMGIKKGGELSDESFRHIMGELLVKRARLRVLNLLKSRDYTKYQLIFKLKHDMYPEAAIENAIDYAASYGYIDDVRYASSYIGYAGASKSRKQIESDLRKKGVSGEDIESAYMQYCEKNNPASEEELIEKLLEKKHYKREESNLEERRKIAAFLYRKGFSLDKIYKVVGEYE